MRPIGVIRAPSEPRCDRNMSIETVRILGAGIAGLTAALNLARHGVQVEVFEKSTTVGHRFHGDFQAFENWSSTIDIYHDLDRAGIELDCFKQEFSRTLPKK